jgi:hypothetical protein
MDDRNTDFLLTGREGKRIGQMRKSFTITDTAGAPVFHVVQKTPWYVRALHLIVSNTWLPFTYNVYDSKDQLVASLRKPAKTSELMIPIVLDGVPLGYIKTNDGLTRLGFSIFSAEQRLIATLEGSFLNRHYRILSPHGTEIGEIDITKQGIMKRLFFPRDGFTLKLKRNAVGTIEKDLMTIASVLIPIIAPEILS